MPNRPMKSTGRSHRSARLEVSPMVARKRWISSSVSPTPLSLKDSVGGLPDGVCTSTAISPWWSGSR